MKELLLVVVVSIISFFIWFNGYDIILPVYAIFITIILVKNWNKFKDDK